MQKGLNVVLPSTTKPTTAANGNAPGGGKSLGNLIVSAGSSSQPRLSTRTVVGSENEENGKELLDRPTPTASFLPPPSSARKIDTSEDEETCMKFLDDPTSLVSSLPVSSPPSTTSATDHHTHDSQNCLDDPSLAVCKLASQYTAQGIFASGLGHIKSLGDSSQATAASLQTAKTSAASFAAADERSQIQYSASGNHERLEVPDETYLDYHPSVVSSSDLSHDLSTDDFTSTLEGKLSAAQLEWPPEGNQYFIPADKLEELVTLNSIEGEIKECHISFAHDEASYQFAERISKTAPKLFAILVLIQKSRFISSFLIEGLDDAHLPFIRSNKSVTGGKFKLCSGLHPNQPIACMDKWRKPRVEEFARVQWYVLAPIFEQSDEVLHYTLNDNCVLPFLGRSKSCDEGGFSTVYEITIHPAHQFLLNSSSPKVSQTNEFNCP